MYGADYVYVRQDGGKTLCYGQVAWDNNYEIVCDDERYDGVACDVDNERYDTWEKVCSYLERHYHSKIEQIEAA